MRMMTCLSVSHGVTPVTNTDQIYIYTLTEELIMKLHSTEYHSYTEFYNNNKATIKGYMLQQLTEFINLDTFESGIANWFGPGSVMLNELGFTIGLTHNDEGTTLTLE